LIPNLMASLISFIVFLFGVGLGLIDSTSDFLGLIFMLIYVGAVAVLFIFVTMLIHFFEVINEFEENVKNFKDQHEMTEPGLVSTFEAVFITVDLEEDSFDIFHDCLDDIDEHPILEYLFDTSELFTFGSLLFTFYFVPLVVTILVLVLLTVGIYFLLYLRD